MTLGDFGLSLVVEIVGGIAVVLVVSRLRLNHRAPHTDPGQSSDQRKSGAAGVMHAAHLSESAPAMPEALRTCATEHQSTAVAAFDLNGTRWFERVVRYVLNCFVVGVWVWFLLYDMLPYFLQDILAVIATYAVVAVMYALALLLLTAIVWDILAKLWRQLAVVFGKVRAHGVRV
jgi:hypothetical protein